MINDELKAFLKDLTTAENADKMGELLSAIQAQDTKLETVQAENQSMKDKLVEMAFRMPIKANEEETTIVPESDEPMSIEEAMARWAEQNLQEK